MKRLHLPHSVRFAAALAIGLAAGIATNAFWNAQPHHVSDFAQLWHAARALLAGENPYEVIGPDKAFPWPFPLLYPLPAVLIAVPFSVLPLRYADVAFVGIGAALLAWALFKDDRHVAARLVFLSAAFATVIVTSQWSTWITAAALMPSFGWLLVCKPTVGAALWLAYPTRTALIGACVLGALSLTVQPFWWRDWFAALPTGTHIQPPILRLGGALILAVLPWWKQREVRLLLALACVPQTPVLYEAVPLFLVTRTWPEAVVLVCSTFLVPIAVNASGPFADYHHWMTWKGYWLVWLSYLPCVGIVLTREWRRARTVERDIAHIRQLDSSDA